MYMRNFTVKRLLMFIAVAGMLTGAEVLEAQTFSHPATGSIVKGDLIDASSGTDYIAVVYSREGRLYFNRLGENGLWSEEFHLGTGSEACIAVDNSDNPHIAYVQADTLYYLTNSGTAWSDKDTIVSLSIGGTGKISKPDIDVDNNLLAHLTYTDSHASSDDYVYPDIMYAVKTGSGFAIQLIHRGYRDYSSSGTWAADYFSKGSYIAVTDNGDFFIMAHQQNIYRWYAGTDNTYFITIVSNLGTGNINNYGSDIFTIHDLHFDGNKVWALYKQSTFKISELTLSGSAIGFSNTLNPAASSVSSIAGNVTDLAMSGISSTKLLTNINDFSHVYNDVAVKGLSVSTVEIEVVFYSVYTDNADGMVKIREVAQPLSITSFSFPEQTGQAFINGQTGTVDVEVAAGTDPGNLTATFLNTSDVTGITVAGTTQTSGVTVKDFSSPVTYILSDGVNTRDWLITVTEEPVVYNVSTVADPVSGGTTSGDGDYNENTVVTVKAKANEGYSFIQWTENETVVSTDTSYTFTVESDRNLKAVFTPQYTLTITTEGIGTVIVVDDVYTDVITANSGTVLNLEAIAGDRYHFAGWEGDLTGEVNPTQITLDKNTAITAVFEIDRYTLTITTEGTGSVEVDDAAYTDVITANSGTVFDLEAIAANGFNFTGWTGDVTSSESSVTVTMEGNKTVNARFSALSALPENEVSPVIFYPNPVVSELFIVTELRAVRCSIYNLSGQKIMDIIPDESNSIDVSVLNEGLYILVLELENGNQLTRKITKQ